MNVPARRDFEHAFYGGPMATHHHPGEGILVARLNGAAQRLAGWDAPAGQERQLAIADLQEVGGDRPGPYARAAGTMLGYHHKGTSSHDLYRNAAMLILEAGGLAEDDQRVQHWIRVGEERRNRARARQRAGDPHVKAWAPDDERRP